MAYTPPTNGKLEIDNIQYDFGKDFRTLERYREYKDCGFDILMQAGETKYTGEPFESSDLKYMMDLAAEAGLKFLVFDERILELAGNNTYGKDELLCGRFKTKEELQDYISYCMEPYMNHPAFLGVILGDEPPYASVYNLTNMCEAIKNVKPEAYIHDCFLPALSKERYASSDFFPGETSITEAEGFRRYIEGMISTGIGVFDYDDYPFGMWKGKNAFNKNYIRNLQIASKTTQKHNTDLYFTIQSFSSGKYDDFRRVDRDDIQYQINLALGFGAKQITYFTYWRFQTRTKYFFSSAIMDDDGTKILYDEVQEGNAYIRKLFPYIKDYRYNKTQLIYTGRKPRAFTNVKSQKIGFFDSISSSKILLVNELSKDEKRAYMIFNAKDSYEKGINHVEIVLKKDTSSVKALVKGEEKILPSEGGKLNFNLEPGEAVWILE